MTNFKGHCVERRLGEWVTARLGSNSLWTGSRTINLFFHVLDIVNQSFEGLKTVEFIYVSYEET